MRLRLIQDVLHHWEISDQTFLWSSLKDFIFLFSTVQQRANSIEVSKLPFHEQWVTWLAGVRGDPEGSIWLIYTIPNIAKDTYNGYYFNEHHYIAMLLCFLGTQNIDSLAPSLAQAVFTTTKGSIIIIITLKIHFYWRKGYRFQNVSFLSFQSLSGKWKTQGYKFTLQDYPTVHCIFCSAGTQCSPTSPGFSFTKKLPPTSQMAVLTNSLSKGYDNFLACCDFSDPTHDSLHSIHPYFELHGSPDHPRAMNANQSSHSCRAAPVTMQLTSHSSWNRERSWCLEQGITNLKS